MPIIIKCSSCGFIFYSDKQLKPIEDVLKQWGFRCPCCLSPLDLEPREYTIKARIKE